MTSNKRKWIITNLWRFYENRLVKLHLLRVQNNMISSKYQLFSLKMNLFIQRKTNYDIFLHRVVWPYVTIADRFMSFEVACCHLRYTANLTNLGQIVQFNFSVINCRRTSAHCLIIKHNLQLVYAIVRE